MSKANQTGETSAATSGDVFDVSKVRRFVQLMKDFDLSEMNLQQGDMHLALKRGTTTVQVPVAPAAAPAPAAPVAAPQAAVEEKPAEDPNLQNITSPIVGTFYSKANPNAKPFVSVGDMVSPEKTVCILEAMKVMNQVPAGIAGKIVAVLVADGDAVEYGQPLFKVDTRG
ncbi:MAG: acetyl-CoA carboxylase biotin carboxyl carrier protein [Planctomycetia bacterium]|nr:acetyl-CoA carboxylase biotin carboxyl carrier protein [Planctomycetia bacterium]